MVGHHPVLIVNLLKIKKVGRNTLNILYIDAYQIHIFFIENY